MCELMLIRPSKIYEEQVMSYKEEMLQNGDNFVVGIIDFRHPLSDFLKSFGDNIGYSSRPSERRKGYASEMLKLILPICHEFGENKVLLTCDKENIASKRTIIKNGGVLENEKWVKRNPALHWRKKLSCFPERKN